MSSAAHAVTFTRGAYAWHGLDADRVHVIPPCIDDASRQERRARSRACRVDRPVGRACWTIVQLVRRRSCRGAGSPDTIVEQAEVTEMRPTPPWTPRSWFRCRDGMP